MTWMALDVKYVILNVVLMRVRSALVLVLHRDSARADERTARMSISNAGHWSLSYRVGGIDPMGARWRWHIEIRPQLQRRRGLSPKRCASPPAQ